MAHTGVVNTPPGMLPACVKNPAAFVASDKYSVLFLEEEIWALFSEPGTYILQFACWVIFFSRIHVSDPIGADGDHV